ncbi:MAG: hypothetical protein K2Q18_04025 [Bdellovibrionales bacterium]|nr:hypothetical protein [Bdellovibrionales bacterium]
MKLRIYSLMVFLAFTSACNPLSKTVNQKSKKSAPPTENLSAATTLSSGISTPLQDEMKASMAANPAGENKTELQIISKNTQSISVAKSNELIEVSKSIVNCAVEYDLVDCQKAVDEASK